MRCGEHGALERWDPSRSTHVRVSAPQNYLSIIGTGRKLRLYHGVPWPGTNDSSLEIV